MSLQEQFDKAAANVRNLKSLPSDNDLLELYALFKQATVGDADPANEILCFTWILCAGFLVHFVTRTVVTVREPQNGPGSTHHSLY